METGVSVIICCYNSAARISETLKYLFYQSTPDSVKWEIVLVDNASTDSTKVTASKLWRELGRSDVRLKVVDQPVQGLSFARSKGIDSAGYSIIIFCDDDNWPESNYVSDAFSILNADPQLGALGGTGIAVSDSSLPDWFEQYRACYACYAQGDSDGVLAGVSASLYGAGMVIRREALAKLNEKKFKPLLTDRVSGKLTSGGDTELSYAIRLIGYKLGFSKKLKFYHFLPSTRLTEKYLYRLNESLAYCSGSLIMYKYVLMGKEVNRFVWLKDAAYQLFLFCNSLKRFLTFTNTAFERKLDLAFSFNSMKSIFSQFGVYRLRYKEILKLKDKEGI